MPEEMSPTLKEYKLNIDKDTQQDPANLIGYLQTMQLAILSGCLYLTVLQYVMFFNSSICMEFIPLWARKILRILSKQGVNVSI